MRVWALAACASVYGDGAEDHIGETLTFFGAGHEDGREDLHGREGPADGVAERVEQGLPEIKALPVRIEKLDGQKAHPRCGGAVGEADCAIGKADDEDKQRQEEEAGEGGKGQNEQHEDQLKTCVYHPGKQALHGDICVELGLYLWIGMYHGIATVELGMAPENGGLFGLGLP